MLSLGLKGKDITTPNGSRSRLCMRERLINWSNSCISCRDKSWTTSKSKHKDKVNNNSKRGSNNSSRSHCYRVSMMSYSNGKIINYYK